MSNKIRNSYILNIKIVNILIKFNNYNLLFKNNKKNWTKLLKIKLYLKMFVKKNYKYKYK